MHPTRFVAGNIHKIYYSHHEFYKPWISPRQGLIAFQSDNNFTGPATNPVKCFPNNYSLSLSKVKSTIQEKCTN